MSLNPGSRLGPHEIVVPIGAGGMGEVYRARDPKLNRDVALKVLPDSLAGDADRLARFRREAQVLASLNHPNIAQIHGFEDSGPSHALVMELVEGPTLADRLAQGPIALDVAVPIARQIADALEAATLTARVTQFLRAAVGGAYVYDVAPGGQRFLVSLPVASTSAVIPLTVVTNWTSLLKK